MKKSLKVFLMVFLVVVTLVAAAVYFFSTNWLRQRLEKEASAALQTPVTIEDLDLRLVPPGIGLDGIKIGDKLEPGKPLITVGSFRVALRLAPLFQKRIEVTDISIVSPHIAMIQEETKAKAPTSSSPSKGAPAALAVKRLRISDGMISIQDLTGTPLIQIEGFEETLSATVDTASNVTLEGTTKIGKLRLHVAGAEFGQGMSIEVEKKLAYRSAADTLEIEKMAIRMGDLPLSVEGSVRAVSSASPDIDLKINGGPVSVATILAYLPAKLVPEMAGVRSEGILSIRAHAKGKAASLDYDVALQLEKGKVVHPKLPSPLEDVQIALHATPKRLDISTFQMRCGGSRVALKSSVQNYQTRPTVDGSIDLDVDLAQAIALQPESQGMRAGGRLKATAKISGRPTPLTALKLDGNLRFENVMLQTPDLPHPVEHLNGQMGLQGDLFYLKKFSGRMGASDFTIDGTVSPAPALLFDAEKVKTIHADVALRSDLLNLDEMTTGEKKESGAIVIPPFFSKLKARAELDARRMIVNRLETKNVKGVVLIEGGKLTIQQFRLDAFEGAMTLNGLVRLDNPKKPTFDLKGNVQNVAAKSLFGYASNLEHLTQLEKYFSGNFNGNVKLKGALGPTGELDMNAVDAEGNLSVTKALLHDHPVQKGLAAMLKRPEIKSISVPKWIQPFKIRDGKLQLDPLQFKTGEWAVDGNGWQSMSGTMGMDLRVTVPEKWAAAIRDQLPSGVSELVAGSKGEPFILPVEVSGSTAAPKIGLNQKAFSELMQERLKSKLATRRATSKERLKTNTQKNVRDNLKKLF